MSSAPLAAETRLRGWDAASMAECSAWRFDVPDAALLESAALARWAVDRHDPVGELRRDSVNTPALDALAAAVAHELDGGSGVAWVRGLRGLPELTLRLTYLKLGLALGPTIDTYGRLYEVRDQGASYRDRAIPVSQTRESTGMHTDSSGRDVMPGVIGLACVRQAPVGGRSRVVSAIRAHDRLRDEHPQLLERLFRPFVRDVVTPGSERSVEAVQRNRFPVFSDDGRVALRYMRYWIERGHERVGEPLEPLDTAAFDALDALLEDPRNVLAFTLEPGDLLFVDNTTTAHDRDAYTDDPVAPRLLLRLWIDRRAGRSVPPISREASR